MLPTFTDFTAGSSQNLVLGFLLANGFFFKSYIGRTFLNDYIDMPEQIIVDYMHATLEGVVKQLLNLWLDSKNHKRAFYLNNSICLDKVLLKNKISFGVS
jgi:hypothetical protein